MIHSLLRLLTLSLFVLISGTTSAQTGHTGAASATVLATASVIRSFGIATFRGTVSQAHFGQEEVSLSQIWAPENRSVLMILQIGQQAVHTQRVRSGDCPNIPYWYSGTKGESERGERVESDRQGRVEDTEITVTLVDPDI